MRKIALGFTDTISISLRRAKTKYEKQFYGLTWSKPGHSDVFINIDKNRHAEDLLDTLMHELYHAVVGMYKFSTKEEEKIATEIGRYKRNRK